MSESYDLIVIGAGAAGLTAAGFGGRINAKVALIEKEKPGGDCTWVGCVPSKALLKVAKVAHSIRTADQYGIIAEPPQIDMPAVRRYVHQAIEDIYQHETPEVFAEGYGVEVVQGAAHFLDANTVQVGERELHAKKIVIATGARATVPPVDGIDAVPYHTNETLFDNDTLPERLLVMGAGPIGMEMAQAYARLGAQVTVMDEALLPRDEPEVAAVMRPIFEREGITFALSLVDSVTMDGDEIVATLKDGQQVRGDMLLVAVGRTPNMESLDLEAAGVQYGRQGIEVDAHLRTNVQHIYAIGDCTTGPKFTHYAGFQGSVAARNALFPVINGDGHMAHVPWVTYVEPEIGHVGMTEAQAREKHADAVKVYQFSMAESDRGVTDNDTAGFIKLVYKGSGDLLGATVVADRAGEMITEFAYVLEKGIGLRGIVDVIRAYPSYSDTVRKAASNLMIEELFSGTSGKVINTVSKILF